MTRRYVSISNAHSHIISSNINILEEKSLLLHIFSHNPYILFVEFVKLFLK